MKVVQVLKDGAMDEIESDCLEIKSISNKLSKLSTSQGNGSFKELYSWPYEGSSVKCFGWYDGEAGFENKHDLPPGGCSRFLVEDSSTQLLYGDIFLLRCHENTLHDFDISSYGEFYNVLFGGFDDCDTDTESEDRNIESEDEDYVVSEDHGVSEDHEDHEDHEEDGDSEPDTYGSDSELDEDDTTY